MEITTGIDYKRLYESSQVEIVELKNQLKNFGNLQLQTLQLQQQLQQLRKMIYGSKQESFVSSQNTNPIQLSLDIQADSVATCSVIRTS